MNDLPPPTVLAEGKYLRLVARGHWEYAERTTATGAVAIVAITAQRRLVLVEQFRIPLGAPVIELPAGLAGDVIAETEESLAETARRELLEETGYEAAEMRLMLAGPTSAGLSNEVVTFFAATGLKKIHEGGGDPHEKIIVHEPPLDGLDQWLRERAAAGALIDPKIFAGLYLIEA
ncbi:MAG TPA: NUDIX hydrolase [Pirellulales bacterium]|jgi:ADP-ribose pyrophosphatase|nr:NUDIX hydrolase [Pirellulales bacterium]